MILVYVAGSFRAPTAWGIERNIHRAEQTGARIVTETEGLCYPVIPHVSTRHFSGLAPDAYFIAGTLAQMRRCDAVMLVEDDPTQTESEGTRGEIAEAGGIGLPIFSAVETLAAWARIERDRGPRIKITVGGKPLAPGPFGHIQRRP